jgi:catechol 2,3-dioxygenase-like lactoylglutathione lyase family enzyme
MATVSVRYIVDSVDGAIAFYTQHLGFSVDAHPAPAFAILSRDDLRLLLNAPSGPGGAAQPMPDGRKPEPGGWNRIQLQVDDLEGLVGLAASRSCSTTPPATPSNFSNPHAREDLAPRECRRTSRRTP